MRELSEQEQKKAYKVFNHLYDEGHLDNNLIIVEYAFAAGLDYQQAEIDRLREALTEAENEIKFLYSCQSL